MNHPLGGISERTLDAQGRTREDDVIATGMVTRPAQPTSVQLANGYSGDNLMQAIDAGIPQP